MQVYRQLQTLSSEQQEEVSELMQQLDGEQKQMLNSILAARSGDRPVTSAEPENGDSPERLYEKLQLLESDEEVVEWRSKIDSQLLQRLGCRKAFESYR